MAPSVATAPTATAIPTPIAAPSVRLSFGDALLLEVGVAVALVADEALDVGVEDTADQDSGDIALKDSVSTVSLHPLDDVLPQQCHWSSVELQAM